MYVDVCLCAAVCIYTKIVCWIHTVTVMFVIRGPEERETRLFSTENISPFASFTGQVSWLSLFT